jgi:transposase
MRRAEALDGSYLLKTDRTDLAAEEIWRIYSLLTRAEDAFRNMKTPLAERPIHHQKEHRVDTHIFLCVLAFHLLVAIETTLRNKGVHSSWSTVREVLKTHQIATTVLPTNTNAILRIRKPSKP